MYKKQRQNLIRTKRCIVDCVLNCSVWPSPIIVEVKVPFAVTAWNLKIGICRYISDSNICIYQKLKNIGISMPALQMKRGWEQLSITLMWLYVLWTSFSSASSGPFLFLFRFLGWNKNIYINQLLFRNHQDQPNLKKEKQRTPDNPWFTMFK